VVSSVKQLVFIETELIDKLFQYWCGIKYKLSIKEQLMWIYIHKQFHWKQNQLISDVQLMWNIIHIEW